MNIIIEKIKNDSNSESLFLNFMKQQIRLLMIPECHESMTVLEATEHLHTINEFNSAFEELNNTLLSKYTLKFDFDNCNSEHNIVCMEVCNYLEQKYGIEYIMNFNSINPKIKVNKKKEVMQNLLKIHANTCSSCNGQRTTYQLEELPEVHKARWKEFPMLKDLDYLLYCKSCDEVSAILK